MHGRSVRPCEQCAVRLPRFSHGAYGELSDFTPITSTGGDCLARVEVRCAEVNQSIAIVKELAARIPNDGIGEKSKLKPAAGAQACNVLEQPRGECYYYALGNGTANLNACACARPPRRILPAW